MASFSFEIEGLEELQTDLEFAMQQYPAEMRKELRNVANKFKKSCISKTPDGDTDTVQSKKLRNKYGVKLKKDNDEYIALVYNSAPHFHLVENGHDLVMGGKLGKGGRVIQWVEGKHMMEKTRNEYRNIIPQRFQKVCDELLRSNNL